MVRKIRSRVALAIAIAAVAFTIVTLVLPSVKTHQVATAAGPASPYNSLNTTLSGYFIPPVEQGTSLTIVVTGYTPKSLSFSMFPTSGSDLSPLGAPLPLSPDFSKPIATVSFLSLTSQAYGIYIVSSNRTQFVIAVEGTWTPFYYLRAYTSFGIFAVLGGFLAYYYFKHFELRRSIEERAKVEAATTTNAPQVSIG